MLIIDDNKMKLLKMKRKLLEVSQDDNERVLEDYRNIIIDIDSVAYSDLVKEITDTPYNDLTLEEQIEFFNQIDADYIYLNELECSFRRIYSNYSDVEIKLSDLNTIDIDLVRERVSAIQGYLMNSKKLENDKLELQKLNIDLISEDKKNNTIKRQIDSLEEKTKNDLLIAEGRLQNNNGGMEYTSVIEEFKNFGIDLRKLLIDSDILNDVYTDAKNEYRDNEEMSEAALICYQNGSNDDRDVYNKIKLDTLKSKYKLILLSLVKEICTKYNDYSLVKNKLNKIFDLIKERKKVLEELNIKYFIDPIDRINLTNYMEVIKLLDDNVDRISTIRQTITYFTSIIEEMTVENENLFNIIKTDINIVKNIEYSYSNNDIVDNENTFDNELNSLLLVADRDDKVVDIRDIGSEFLIARAYEKANGVINRVNALYNGNSIKNDIIHFETTPELIIESVSQNEGLSEEVKSFENGAFNEDNDVTNLKDDTVGKDNSELFEDEKPFDNEVASGEKKENEGLFEEVKPFENGASNEENMFTNFNDDNKLFEDEKPFSDNILKDNNQDVMFDDVTPFSDTSSHLNSIEKNSSDNDLFEEVVPFEVTPLFNDRYDDDIFNSKQKTGRRLIDIVNEKSEEELENTMPDIFWNASDEDKKVLKDEDRDDKVLSFDEQVEKLVGNSKTLKKVA